MSYRIGIDVGGTFTDFLVARDGHRALAHKTSTTPQRPTVGLMRGLQEIAERLGQPWPGLLESVETIVHGTTVATNALLTRSGAKTGLLCTHGFRDVLAMRDGTKEAAYDNRVQPPEPLVPRYRRRGIRGRLDRDGAELEPLDEDGVRAAVGDFAEEGVTAVAISFMHSPANSGHERRAAEIVRELLPDAYVTVSSELLPQVRYYDRTSTAVLNSYVGPIILEYLTELRRELTDAGFVGHLLIMQSNGGVAAPEEVVHRAALSLLSGPASGPASGVAAIREHGLRDCLTVDMGGTSFDAALVKDGEPLFMADAVIDRWRIALPTIDIHTIGAGGGSVATVSEGGLLRVGPESAGAHPGPVCYRRGGTQATVTDADLVLGYLDPDRFLEGRMPLDRDGAHRAILEQVGVPLGLDAIEAAAGIYDLVNVAMATGVREVTVRRGLDPRELALVVAGGAGPVHAAAIARELEIPVLVVPRQSSIFCAEGMLLCDFRHDFVISRKERLGEGSLPSFQELWSAMRVEGLETLAREGVAADRAGLRPSLDLRYAGQWWDINLPLPPSILSAGDREDVAEAFHALHERLFGFRSAEMPIEVLNVRLTVVGVIDELASGRAGDGGADDVAAAAMGHRRVWSVADRDMVEVPVYDGSRLGSGACLDGPAIVELATTTIVVLEEYDLRVDGRGSFILARRQETVSAGAPSAPASTPLTKETMP